MLFLSQKRMKVKSIFCDDVQRKQIRRHIGCLISPVLSIYELDCTLRASDFRKMKSSIDKTSKVFMEEGFVNAVIDNPVGRNLRPARRGIELLASLSLLSDARKKPIMRDKTYEGCDIIITSSNVFHPFLFSPRNLRDSLYVRVSSKYENAYFTNIEYMSKRISYLISLKSAAKPQTTKSRRKNGNHTTQRCKICGSKSNLTTHHIIPKRYGGPDSSRNSITICKSCHNNSKGIEIIISMYERGMNSMPCPKAIGIDPAIILFNVINTLQLIRYFRDESVYYGLTQTLNLLMKNMVNSFYSMR